ncbi:MAG: S1 RNA-binding domain-containing protein [Nanoarchaeota archaeon]|nr:S1 RNA-binding domain-containing protein [Nanoarchaeota archaeon]
MAYEEKKFPEPGELVLCRVKEIMKTTVFVNLEKYGKTGVIPTSEIAPGRIRNIRDYVVINKRIICKVLRVDRNTGHIDLSLRRVSQKETKEEFQKYENEDIALKILRIVIKENAEKVAGEIKKDHPFIHDFFESSILDPSALNAYLSKEDAKKILDIIREKMKPKKIVLKTMLEISSSAPNGLVLIKDILSKQKDVAITYIGAPNYLMIVEDENPKIANKKIETAINSIMNLAKKSGVKVEVKKKD